jgi:hypothetical protein
MTEVEESPASPTLSGHAGELAVAVARVHGVETMFTLSGAHVFPMYDGAVKAEPPMRLLDVRHEQTAAFAAEATGKLTRVPGLAVLTAGPGVTRPRSSNAGATSSPRRRRGGGAHRPRSRCDDPVASIAPGPAHGTGVHVGRHRAADLVPRSATLCLVPDYVERWRMAFVRGAVQAGMPLLVLARNLGHADTRMVERHYGHLSDRYVRDEVNRFAPALLTQ